jgi:hypothetical protein
MRQAISSPGPISTSSGAGSDVIVVMLSGAHLHSQVLEVVKSNGQGGSALSFHFS